MSHLTSRAPPFRRPLVAEHRPPLLPSPPDTDSDFPSAQTKTVPPMLSMPSELEPPLVLQPPPQPRRTSSLAYHNTPIRTDSIRERPTARASKWLVVVLPSDSLTSNLSNGLRASQGTLMPLLPTLYAQLTAIAREFAFPSIVGLAVFLHVSEHGATATPRVSEDTWQILWGHLFDARSPSVPFAQLPVCGRIELDIDPSKARWFDAWVAQRRRTPQSVAPSVSHWRGDSKTTFLEDVADEQNSEIFAAPPPRPRHVPRQLSLLGDRLETGSVASSMHLPPAFRSSKALDPEPELRELVSGAPGRDDKLANRVHSWRASSSVAPSPMAATGQISLDPAHMPNNIEIRSPPTPEDDELRLEDFQWSISSVGPGDEETPETPVMWRRTPSVHLAGRAEGSVLLSPTSIATSWGPTYDGEDYLDSPVSWTRLSSVDLARRLEGSVVLTPSVATTWGPSSDDGYEYFHEYSSAYEEHNAPSPHLAERCLSDAPMTPSTATSWGPDAYYREHDHAHFDVHSLASWRPHTPDIGDRFSCPPTPATATSWGPASWPPSEAAFSRCSTPDVGARARLDDHDSHARTAHPLVWPYTLRMRLHEPSGVSALVFPYFQPDDVGSRWVWPYIAVVHAPEPVDVRLAKQYPAVGPYEAVYPHFEIYPGHIIPAEVSDAVADVRLPAAYPRIELYPAAYPHFEIYPGHVHVFEREIEPASVRLPAHYPVFDIYPAVYPVLEIYPVAHVRTTSARPAAASAKALAASASGSAVVASAVVVAVSVAIAAASVPAKMSSAPVRRAVEPTVRSNRAITNATVDYRMVVARNLARYPEFVLYPVLGEAVDFDKSELALPAMYPVISLYPASYPAFEVYPGVVCDGAVAEQPMMTLVALYPVISLYPAQYPAFEIYPGLICDGELAEQPLVQLPALYPLISLYPACYPAFEIYPGVVCDGEVVEQPSAILPSLYPVISLYPACYPAFEIYPGVVCDGEGDVQASVILSARYPVISLYPAQYPAFEIYPGYICDGEIVEQPSTTLPAHYPVISLYPACYPAFEIYPGVVCDGEVVEEPSITLPALYPTISLYPARYPFFELYPGIVCDGSLDARLLPVDVHLQPAYPHIALYPARYPAFEIYPGNVSDGELAALSVGYPHFDIYPAVHQLTPSAAASKSLCPAPARRAYKPRHSHAQLHTEVLAAKPFKPILKESSRPVQQHFKSTEEPSRPIRAPVPVKAHAPSHSARYRPLYTHAQLHAQVFPPSSTNPFRKHSSPQPWKHNEGHTSKPSEGLAPSLDGAFDVKPFDLKPFDTLNNTNPFADPKPADVTRKLSLSMSPTRGPLHRRTDSREGISRPSSRGAGSGTESPTRPLGPRPREGSEHSPVTRPTHHRSDSGESTSSLRGPRPAGHRRTESTESTESIDSVTGMPRRRDPPPVAYRAPVAARRRSGTVVQPPAAPPPPIDIPPTPEDVPEELLPPPTHVPVPRRRLEHGATKHGLPSNPAHNRPPPPPPPRYPHNLSPVEERPPTALHRASSLVSSRPIGSLVRKSSMDGGTGVPRRRPRDSVVLERARLYDGSGHGSGSGGDEDWRTTLGDFPAVPPPPVPALPPGAGRPAVGKLDRSRYTFAA